MLSVILFAIIGVGLCDNSYPNINVESFCSPFIVDITFNTPKDYDLFTYMRDNNTDKEYIKSIVNMVDPNHTPKTMSIYGNNIITIGYPCITTNTRDNFMTKYRDGGLDERINALIRNLNKRTDGFSVSSVRYRYYDIDYSSPTYEQTRRYK